MSLYIHKSLIIWYISFCKPKFSLHKTNFWNYVFMLNLHFGHSVIHASLNMKFSHHVDFMTRFESSTDYWKHMQIYVSRQFLTRFGSGTSIIFFCILRMQKQELRKPSKNPFRVCITSTEKMCFLGYDRMNWANIIKFIWRHLPQRRVEDSITLEF